MNEFLQMAERWSEAWSASLWRASWQGAIAIALVWVVVRWYTSLSPRVVCWAWRLVCLKLLSSLVWISPIEIPVLPPAPASPVNVTASPQSITAATFNNDGPLPQVTANPRMVHVDVSELGINIRLLLLMLAWLIGVCGFMILTAMEWIFAGRLCHLSHTPTGELLANLCRREAHRLTVRHVPRIQLARVDGPLLVGIWRPTIVLPEHAEELFDESELRLMLGHELTHLKRRDLLWNWLPTVVAWLLFFHPLVWLLKRGWFESQEAACDELLIQKQVTQPAEYGRLLLKLSTIWSNVPLTGMATAGVLGAYQNLERRILAMTNVKTFSRNRLFLVAGTLLLIATCGIAPWRLVAQESNQKTVSGAVTDGSDKLPGKIYVWADLEMTTEFGTPGRYRGFVVIDPNTGAWAKLGTIGHSLRVSPDGSRLAFDQFRTSRTAKPVDHDNDIFWADVINPEPMRVVENGRLPIWSPDSNRLLYHVDTEKSEHARWHGAAWMINLNSDKEEKLPIPETDEVNDWSLKDNWFVTVSDRHPPFGSGYQLYVMHPDGSEERRITESQGLNCYPQFSPDAKHLYIHINEA